MKCACGRVSASYRSWPATVPTLTAEPSFTNIARFLYTVPRLRSGYSGFSRVYSISALGCSVVFRSASYIASRFLLYFRASIAAS